MLWVVALSALHGCEKARGSETSNHILADISISVTNATSTERSIFLEAASREYSLGDVAGHETRLFSVPSGAGDPALGLRLRASRRTLPVVHSAPFHLNPGDRHIWVVNER